MLPLSDKLKVTLFYLVSVFFILLNAWFVVAKDSWVLHLVPLVLLVVLIAFFALDKLLYLAVFLTPLSIPLSYLRPGLPVDMFLPTEPLLVGMLMIFILKICSQGFDRDILKHPITIAVFINLGWMVITTFTSSMPMVSVKFVLVRLWFLAGFYFIASQLFKDTKNMEKYVWLYVIALLIVFGYAFTRHLGYGLLNKNAAHVMPNPFYKDHTSYGAVIAMYLPFLFGFSFSPVYKSNKTWLVRVVWFILIVGLILSYTRAAWLSLIVVFGIWVLMKLQIRFKPLFISFLTMIALVFTFQSHILAFMEQNDKESSSDLAEHLYSMWNITSDASNTERINRWSCAISMFKERPVFGYGPGTYMFKYAPYQLKKERTIISTNYGDGGNAHSEYLGPLSESGLPGMLTFMLLIGVVIYVAIHAYSRTSDKRLKTILMAALLGLITYYIHGFLNNFLDTDKISAPFWGFTAMIVVIDLHTRKQLPETHTSTSDKP